MSVHEVRNRAAAKIIKWLLVQINNGIIPNGHMSWSYNPTMDSVWDLADIALLDVNVVKGLRTKSETSIWDYKTKISYADIETSFDVTFAQFKNLLSAILLLMLD